MRNSTKIFQSSKVYTNGIHIPFSEIFGRNFDDISDFDLSAKRTYSNQVNFIIEENNKIIALDRDNEILANYLMIKHKIDKQRYTDPDMFVRSLVEEVMKPWFLDSIKAYVRETYKKECVDIDAGLHNNGGRLNASLVFTNEHSIILYDIANVFRFIAPLATHFMRVYADTISNREAGSLYDNNQGGKIYSQQQVMADGKKMFNKAEFLMYIAKQVIALVTNNNPDINIYGKLNFYITSIIRGTARSDGDMWNTLALRGTNKYTLTDVIMAKILIDILPKASFKKSAIKFVVTTIEAHIKWALHEYFEINYNIISPFSEESDFSDTDRFEIKRVNVNEWSRIMSEPQFIEDTISIIFRRRNFVLNRDEYEYYLGTVTMNSIQDNLVRNFFSFYFSGWNNLEGLTKEQYIKLLIYLKYRLMTGGKFKILPQILTGNIITMNEKRILNRPIERKIKESIRYVNIMKRYTHTGTMLAKSNTIESQITLILNSRIEYNEYQGKNNGDVIVYDIAALCDEYLNYIEIL
jgi:hypothetical protein